MKRTILIPLLAAVLIGASGSGPAPTASPDDLMQEFDTLCLGPSGDRDLTWAWAVRKGYEPLDPAAFERLRILAFARDLRGMSRTVDGVEYRVLAARGSMAPVGTNEWGFYSLCWVSAEPSDRRQVRRLVEREFRLPSFVQGNARIFAWIETAEGRRPIRRPEFERRMVGPIMQEQDLRLVSLASYADGQVMLGYMKRRDPDAGDVEFFERRGREPPAVPPAPSS